MGMEYRIRFKTNSDEVERRIRALPYFVSFDSEHRLYLLHVGSPADAEHVNGWVAIEEGGLYFCDNLAGSPADRATIFRAIIDLALEQSQTVEVEEL